MGEKYDSIGLGSYRIRVVPNGATQDKFKWEISLRGSADPLILSKSTFRSQEHAIRDGQRIVRRHLDRMAMLRAERKEPPLKVREAARSPTGMVGTRRLIDI